MEKITTALYDEKKLTGECFYEALKSCEEPEVCFRAASEASLFEHLKCRVPDVLILHLRPDKKEHRRLIGKVNQRFPGVSPLVLLINYEPTPGEVFNLVAAGAKGIIPDWYSHHEFMEAMEEVSTYGVHCNRLCPGEMFELSKRKELLIRNSREMPCFSERESRIISLKKEGMTSVQVGLKLYISDRTVDNTLNKLYERFNCHNITELILIYDRHKMSFPEVSR